MGGQNVHRRRRCGLYWQSYRQAFVQAGVRALSFMTISRRGISHPYVGDRFVEGDILDTQRLIEVVADHDPIAVIHFAASAYVGESVEHPAKYYRNNVSGTQSLLEACRLADDAQCHLFVELRNLWRSGSTADP